ncbi:MAG: NUDIX domain-containing protein [Bacilli bacterium]
MKELWDAYDKDLNKVNGITLVRGEPIKDGLYHLICEIVDKHIDGTYLLMQRDMCKTHPLKWELSAGGSALIGESSLDGALRELKEETGIVGNNLKKMKTIVLDHYQCISVIYLCITDCDKTSITLQEGETISYKWVDRNVILNNQEDIIPERVLDLFKKNII